MSTKHHPAEMNFSTVTWRKSTYSGGGDNCVELGRLPGLVAVRDSKCPDRTPLVFSPGAITSLIISTAQATAPRG
ncbi:DUF397 domain-containing protein [Streptomyces sp. NPDC088925]|uniref:DUF397 domain-containing protein n=1 Tax=Streptomyces sp. NPDC088925 TaxID=3365914 RepID=UPI003825B7E9